MYAAGHFRATPDEGRAIIRANPFGRLISRKGDGFAATHVPMLLSGDDRLIGHVARANDHWRDLDGASVVALFEGPHCHVSPTWYATSPAVPTWDYEAAHAHGTASLVEEPAALEALLDEIAQAFEADGWRLRDQPDKFRQGMIKGLVGFAVRIERIEAIRKLSQNRSAADRQGVVVALRQRGHGDDRRMAQLIERTLPAD